MLWSHTPDAASLHNGIESLDVFKPHISRFKITKPAEAGKHFSGRANNNTGYSPPCCLVLALPDDHCCAACGGVHWAASAVRAA